MNKIKILTPIDNVDEFELLSSAGADEFYCGVIINDKKYNSDRIGKQKQENISGISELKKLVKKIKDNKKDLYLVLNAQYLSSRDINEAGRRIDAFKKIGIDNYIVSNLNLIDKVKDKDINIIISSFLEAKNVETVKFLKKFKPKRIILDRQITASDLKAITSEFPRLEFETFIMEAACRSLDSYCNRHIFNYKKHTCRENFKIDNKKGLTRSELNTITSRLKMPIVNCGICALYQFRNLNVESVKIVGRGYPTKWKVKNVKHVRDALGVLNDTKSKKEYHQKCLSLFKKTYNFPCNKEYCYYPHFFKN